MAYSFSNILYQKLLESGSNC